MNHDDDMNERKTPSCIKYSENKEIEITKRTSCHGYKMIYIKYMWRGYMWEYIEQLYRKGVK